MEPVTHMLTGACLGRAGLNRRAAYATAAMAVAAEFPDIDTLWGVRGPVASFAHHRGITHTFVGLPVEAAVVVTLFWGVHRWRARRGPVATAAPVRWGLLYLFALGAMLSHLFLDWTNNYGLRPFLPFDTRWYAGSFVFIFDPILFGLLLLPFVLPPLFGLIGSEVGARRARFRGRGWALASVVLICSYWALRAYEHARAVTLAAAQTVSVEDASVTPAADATPQMTTLEAQRVLVNPDPFSPLRWHAVTDFGGFYQLADVDLRSGNVTPEQATLPKPVRSAAVLAAMASPLGRAYMDWSPMPVVTSAATAEGTAVTFRDPRFMLRLPMMGSQTDPPLTGVVVVGADGGVVEERMGGSGRGRR